MKRIQLTGLNRVGSRFSFNGLGRLLCLILLAALPVRAEPAVVRVDTTKVVQPDFLGVNAVYHGFAYMPEQINKGFNDDDRAREFDRVQRIGLNIARTWYRPNYSNPQSLWDAPDWETVRMKALYRWLEAMKSRNVEVALGLGWWFTRDTSYGHEAPDATVDPERFAGWISESLHQIIEVKGFTNVKYGILFTEPTAYKVGPVPEGFTQWTYYVRVVRAIHERLVKDHRRGLVKLVGPNNSDAAFDLANAVKDLGDVIDIFSGHNYGYKDYAGWYGMADQMRQLVAKTGKPFWIDEWGIQKDDYRATPDFGTYLALGTAAFINGGAQTGLYWTLFDQQYVARDGGVGNTTTNKDAFRDGVQHYGTAKWARDQVPGPSLPYASWYAFSLLSKYLPGGDQTIAYATTGTEGVQGAAIKRRNGDWSFLVVNETANPVDFKLSISAALNLTLERYLYDPANVSVSEAATLNGPSKTFKHVRNGLSDTLPPRGVAIYTNLSDAKAK